MALAGSSAATACASEALSFDDGTPTAGRGSPGFGRPNLRVLSSPATGRTASAGSIWKGSEEAPWWRNPLLAVGVILAVMLLLILFW